MSPTDVIYTRAELEQVIEKYENQYFSDNLTKADIPRFNYDDEYYGECPAFAFPMKKGEKFKIHCNSNYQIRAANDQRDVEVVSPSSHSSYTYVNPIRYWQPSTIESARVNRNMELAKVTEISDDSLGYYQPNINTELTIASLANKTVIIEAVEDCIMIVRDIGVQLANTIFGALSQVNKAAVTFRLLVEEIVYTIEETKYTVQVIGAFIPAFIASIFWARYKLQSTIDIIARIASGNYHFWWDRLGNYNGHYIQNDNYLLPELE